jgi:hypothetical protein
MTISCSDVTNVTTDDGSDDRGVCAHSRRPLSHDELYVSDVVLAVPRI